MKCSHFIRNERWRNKRIELETKPEPKFSLESGWFTWDILGQSEPETMVLTTNYKGFLQSFPQAIHEHKDMEDAFIIEMERVG